jgi:hypothetical protein
MTEVSLSDQILGLLSDFNNVRRNMHKRLLRAPLRHFLGQVSNGIRPLRILLLHNYLSRQKSAHSSVIDPIKESKEGTSGQKWSNI